MRLSLTASALLPLFCLGSCFGGPTSDYPHRNSGPSDDGDDEPPHGSDTTKGNGGGQDTSTPPPVVRDAGKAAGGQPSNAADAGSVRPMDGGVLAVGDAGADGGVPPNANDGSVGSSCTEGSDLRDAGYCFGVYCSSTPAQLLQSVATPSGCSDPEDVKLACDGALSRVVSACAQDNALELGFGMTVDDCARMDPSIADASDACIDCYVGEMVCSVQNCLAPCLAGLSLECTSCRATHCGAAFAMCSGLPRP